MIHLDDIEHGYAIADKAGTVFVPRVHRAISRTVDGNLAGGVVYTDYTRRAISMHVASWHRRWLNRDLLWSLFTYPFDVLKVEQCLAFVPSTNIRAVAFDINIGFKLKHTIEDVVPGGHLMVLSMRREDCRWLAWKPRYLETDALKAREKGA